MYILLYMYQVVTLDGLVISFIYETTFETSILLNRIGLKKRTILLN